jgi:hypothetical protein
MGTLGEFDNCAMKRTKTLDGRFTSLSSPQALVAAVKNGRIFAVARIHLALTTPFKKRPMLVR